MNEGKGRTTKVNPFTTGLITGLGWGLALGFLDGLPILLEFPILLHLRVRLQALTYLMVWYALAGAVVFGLLGLIAWGILQALRLRSGQGPRREIERHKLIAIYSGISLGLASLVIELHNLELSLAQIAAPEYAVVALVPTAVAGAIGLFMGLGVYGWASWWQRGQGTGPVRPVQGFLRPLRWKVAWVSVVAVFLGGVIVLSAVGVYRNYLRHLAIFRPTPSGQVATFEQPNVVLITIDALRAGHLGIYGYDPKISPNIDALARRGVVFDQAISQAPWTVPSTASFLTSLYPTELGIFRPDWPTSDLRVDEMRVTLAEVLQAAGYWTEAYACNPFIAPENGYDQGFDRLTYPRDQLSFDLNSLQGRTLPWLLCSGSTKPGYSRAVCRLFNQGYGQLFDPRLGWMGDRWTTEYAKRFLRLHEDERFFLWLFYVGPHTPYDPPEPFRPLPSEITRKQEQGLRHASNELNNLKDAISSADLQALLSLYDGEIAYTDSLVGQVIDELDRLGLADRTVIILSADHGEEFADHGSYLHGALYDEVVRVPFIISGAGVEAAGRRVETQVRLLDLVPTVCEIAGVPVPEEAEGRSLAPFLRGENLEELPTFSEVRLWKAVRYNGYKLIHNAILEETELYDLRADPHEHVNLAEREPEIADMMLADLNAWVARCIEVAAELPQARLMDEGVEDEMRQRLRDAGY
jgi:arylsulfatase A-like enzyme